MNKLQMSFDMRALSIILVSLKLEKEKLVNTNKVHSLII